MGQPLLTVRSPRGVSGQALPVPAWRADPGVGLLGPVKPPGQPRLEQAGRHHRGVEGGQRAEGGGGGPGQGGQHRGLESPQTGQAD